MGSTKDTKRHERIREGSGFSGRVSPKRDATSAFRVLSCFSWTLHREVGKAESRTMRPAAMSRTRSTGSGENAGETVAMTVR